ncbi:hypothetical protein, partial [Aeromonas sobria]|uniref:hypothetical protein n=1 Tax=Aeromonas sobria TaxID=646 RepID=UPI001CA32221
RDIGHPRKGSASTRLSAEFQPLVGTGSDGLLTSFARFFTRDHLSAILSEWRGGNFYAEIYPTNPTQAESLDTTGFARGGFKIYTLPNPYF